MRRRRRRRSRETEREREENAGLVEKDASTLGPSARRPDTGCAGLR